MQSPNKIAVIGAGRMGGGIARNLAKNGFTIKVFDPSPEAVAKCQEAGATSAASASAAAAEAELVITSLPLPEHVIATFAELAPQLAPGTVCMDVSTVDPSTASKLEASLQEHGLHFVACPLGKGPAQAEAGELPLFIGGDAQVVDALSGVFSAIGGDQYPLGGVEAATMFKLVSNLIGMTNLAVLAEGYLLCRKAGVEDEAFQRALADTGGWSYQAELRLPWMINRDFAQRFGVRLGLKDLRLAVDQASQWGIPVPVGALGMSQLANAVAHGFGDDDVNAILKVLDPQNEVLGNE